MPVACSTSAISGTEGSVSFKPAGTTFCLLDSTDFPAGLDIFVPFSNDFRVGDPVVFTEEGNANLDSALTPSQTYYITAEGSGGINVAATAGGTPILLNGDGGTGGADTPGSGNHIRIGYAEFAAVCQVGEWTAELIREELDVTTLACSFGGNGTKYAPTKSYIPSYIDASGTMTVFFTPDQDSLANRILGNSLLRNQDGASVRLYASTVSDGAGGVDDNASLYIESDIVILGFSTSVNPDDPTQAELNFRLNNIKNIFGNQIA